MTFMAFAISISTCIILPRMAENNFVHSDDSFRMDFISFYTREIIALRKQYFLPHLHYTHYTSTALSNSPCKKLFKLNAAQLRFVQKFFKTTTWSQHTYCLLVYFRILQAYCSRCLIWNICNDHIINNTRERSRPTIIYYPRVILKRTNEM